MKKLFTPLFIIFLSYGMSQSLSFTHDGKTYKHNDTIRIDLPLDQPTLDVWVEITNVSEDYYSLRIRQKTIQLAADATLGFCFGLCYVGDATSNPSTIAPGETLSHDNEKALHITYTNAPGVTEAKYTLFNSDAYAEPDTNVLYVVINSPSVGIAKTSSSAVLLNAYPNPATEQVTIEYNFPNQSSSSSFVLKNMMGVVVLEEELSQKTDKIEINLSNIPRGLYFYSIENNGKAVLAKKLIVR